eukprot:GHRQ01037729.1.p1 GENE.GHRQ01037729.1~~GHRQ01037729.1.p1  ORF type:complete len:161 (+),score=42.79 GHRQ01037729.1:593-1075(+)
MFASWMECAIAAGRWSESQLHIFRCGRATSCVVTLCAQALFAMHVSSSSSSSRRGLLALAGAVAAAPFTEQLLLPGRAHAYIVDETVAQSVFALAARSVVSINDFKQQGGAEIFEGVGTGFVWDSYGHSKCIRWRGTCACRAHVLAGSVCLQHQQYGLQE